MADAEELVEPPFREEDAAVESASASKSGPPFRSEDAAVESASKPKPKAPPHPDDEVRLVDLPEVAPVREEQLRYEAGSFEHQLTHFPKNPFCPICNIAKNTSMRVARKPDGKADDKIDLPTAPLQQLATDDVILAKGDDHAGNGLGGVKSHHVVPDV